MNLPRDSHLWSPAVARQVDAVCDRFEGAHRAGRRPQIEDYLAGTPDPEQPILLRELLALDLAYRSRRGEVPTAEEYARQLPDHIELIRDVFDQAAPGSPASMTRYAVPSEREPMDSGGGRSQTPLPGLETSNQGDPAAWGPAGTGPDPAGSVVPGYEILGVLGQGGMGIVYRARQLPLRRLVALKMLRADSHPEPEQLRRFHAEAEAVARLQHPHIVQIYEIGTHAGLPYLALEFVEGSTLAQWLDGAPLPPDQAAPLLETVARAIHYAHQQGIVHRDLKPANVLLSFSGRSDYGAADASARFSDRPLNECTPKVTDFGLAKRLDADTGQTHSGAVVGTPSYMAPEQAQGKNKEVGPAADVYALGVLLYETLTGRPPFRGATVLETLGQVLTQEPVPLSRLQPKVPRDLETICLKCLEKEPHRRYATAEALAEDLRRWRAGEPIHARPTPAWERGLKWAQRRRTTAALSAVSILAVLGLAVGGGFYLEQQRRLEGQRARLAEQEVNALQEVGRRRDQVQELTREGEAAAKGEHWEEALTAYDKALTVLESEPRLVSRRDEVQRLRREAEEKHALGQDKARAVARRARFDHYYNEALFHGILLAGVDPSRNWQAARDAAQSALDLFGVSANAEAGPVFTKTITPAEHREIIAACYELLLLLAEVEAQQGTPEHVRAAIDILNRAARLGLRTRAYQLRLAHYWMLLHNEAAARQATASANATTPTDVLDEFLMGDEEQRRPGLEHLRAAVHHFERAAEQQKDHFWAHFFLAVCYLRLQRWDLAKGPLNACVLLRPDFPRVHLLRGFAHTELGEFRAAEDDFQKAEEILRQKPDEDASYSLAVYRGVLHRHRKEDVAAVAQLQEAVRLRPKQYEAYLALAQLYEQQQRPERAIAELTRAADACQASHAGVPALQLVYRSRGRLLRESPRADEWESALLDLRQAIALEPPGSTAPELAEDHFRCGQVLQRLNRYPEARAAFEAALTVPSRHAGDHLRRGEILLALERHEEAVGAFDKYLLQVEKGREAPAVYRLRGLARAWLLDYAGAVEDYTRALGVARDPALLALRGQAYLFQDALTPALHDFQEALSIDRANGDAYNGRAFVHARRGQYRQAVADANQALDCAPENARDPRLLCNAARVFAQAAGGIDAERGRSTRPVLEERSTYQDRAVRLLRQALELQHPGERRAFWRKIIVPDRALDPIRRPGSGYRELEAEYGRGGTPAAL
jgi:serine/threonine protein kinase/tetratricopeptide (TPR) repeat protein